MICKIFLNKVKKEKKETRIRKRERRAIEGRASMCAELGSPDLRGPGERLGGGLGRTRDRSKDVKIKTRMTLKNTLVLSQNTQ